MNECCNYSKIMKNDQISLLWKHKTTIHKLDSLLRMYTIIHTIRHPLNESEMKVKITPKSPRRCLYDIADVYRFYATVNSRIFRVNWNHGRSPLSIWLNQVQGWLFKWLYMIFFFLQYTISQIRTSRHNIIIILGTRSSARGFKSITTRNSWSGPSGRPHIYVFGKIN